MSGALVAFWALSAIAVIAAIATVTRRNAVAGATWLVGSFVGVAGLYALLSLQFLAVLQVLVYAGAIMVIFVFVIMALDRPEEHGSDLLRTPIARAIGLGALAFLLWRLVPVLAAVPEPGPAAPGYGGVREIGRLLLGDQLFAFEAISLLLLAAIAGAVAIGRPARGRRSSAAVTPPPSPAPSLPSHAPAPPPAPASPSPASGAVTPGAAP